MFCCVITVFLLHDEIIKRMFIFFIHYFLMLVRAFRLGRKDLLLFSFFIIRAFRLGRKDLLLFSFFIIIRAFRLRFFIFFIMKLLVLSIKTHPWNTSGFVTSGSTLSRYFRKLNLRKELNLSQILLEVNETLQLYSACLNKQKSQWWPPSIFYSFQDSNPWRLRNVTSTKNTNMNGKLFLFYIYFSKITYIWISKFQHHIFIILFLMNFWIFP